MSARVFRNEVTEGGDKKPTARLVDPITGDVLIQSSFTGSVLVRVFDLSVDPTDAILSNTRTIAATVFNSLQDWPIDSDGYNFQDTITSNEALGWRGDHTYRISYLLTKATGGYLPVMFETRAIPAFSI